MANSRLEERVTRAAEATLAEQSYVSAIDVLLRLGWLAPPHLALWRQGRVECLERMVQAGLGKQSTVTTTSKPAVESNSRVERSSSVAVPSRQRSSLNGRNGSDGRVEQRRVSRTHQTVGTPDARLG